MSKVNVNVSDNKVTTKETLKIFTSIMYVSINLPNKALLCLLYNRYDNQEYLVSLPVVVVMHSQTWLSFMEYISYLATY